MKKIIIILFGIGLISCSGNQHHPDFEKNKAVIQKFVNLHSVEDWEAQAELLHEDLSWSQPVYGSENYGKDEHFEAMKMYQSMFDNIKYETEYWLAGIDPETGIRDGSVRTYGTWTGVHTETGKEFKLNAYHAISFKDGKIVGGGDYFDFGGFMASFQD